MSLVTQLDRLALAQVPTAVDGAFWRDGRTYLDLVYEVGWSFWPIAACLLIGLVICLVNLWSLRRGRFLQPKIVEQVRGKIRGMDLDGARQLCAAYPSPMTDILRAGLTRVEHEFEAGTVDNAMEAAANDVLTRAGLPTHYLGLLAVAAPLLGFLGSVTGVMHAAASLASGTGLSGPLIPILAEVLLSSAFGIAVALALFVAQGIFTAWLAWLTSSIQRTATDVSATLGSAIRQAYANPSQ